MRKAPAPASKHSMDLCAPYSPKYRDADNPLARPTSRCILFDGEDISFDACLLTPWSRVLLEKLTDSAASQEIPLIFGTRMFFTVFTSARHMYLS